MANDEYLLEMENISKAFPGVQALDQVHLRVRRQSVHALCGENGAGKSTLMKILIGMYKSDEGEIRFAGQSIHFSSVNDAIKNGIAMIYQELNVMQTRTVSENIFLGKEIRYPHSFLLNHKEMIRQTQTLFDRLHINIDPRTPMNHLSISQQQLCEIAKAFSYNAKLIIMDEPTSAITEEEVENLFRIIRDLVASGVSVIYITHKMDEIFKIADEVSIYRDGHYVSCHPTVELTKEKIIADMVGRSLTDMFPKLPPKIQSDILLKVENLSSGNKFHDVNFELRRGEILGVAGLVGSGRSEIMETLFGIRKKNSGSVTIKGEIVNIRHPRIAISRGMAFLTEDRKSNGCFLSLSIERNIAIASLRRYLAEKGRLFIDPKKIRANFNQVNQSLNIKMRNLEQKVLDLSGGNQQKVLVARWLLTEPDILIVDEPTRGIDVGAKAEIHRILSTLTLQGKGVIMISSELPEILGMSDRVLVINEGRVAAVLDRKDATQELILAYAAGMTDVS